MNLLFIYLLGCSISYTISKHELKLIEENDYIKSFFDSEQKRIKDLGINVDLKKIYLIFYVLLSWIKVFYFCFKKLKF